MKRINSLGPSLLALGTGMLAMLLVWFVAQQIFDPAATKNVKPSPPPPIVIQFPPWWVILSWTAGVIVFFLLLFLLAGPSVLFLRKYYQKFYIPAFSDELPSEIEKIAQVNPADIQQVVATQLAISSSYYETVLQQSKRSFTTAIIFAGIGLCFFIGGVSFIVYRDPGAFANPSLIAGALTELLSGINFYLYGSATKQLETFHIRLDGIQRFVIANSVCENLEGEIKQTTRAKLVQAMYAGSVETDLEKKSLPEKEGKS
ncbi:hypothetical protein KSF_085930 [Reticulibacter mediterranei]|uniref:Cyanobacterial TRADD-N associated 2 transmembrane domain-containing protein n=1 Tax=Reticulibacter mediterranei TaxID=2778369 RepID=A0A8J3N7J7_9CHLR|nr:hypothetical protein [Reticulibacter mediterranei]GHO98545.1 hypothetical protein KSF_085930 [Reticulibacter mediterranei]